MTKAQNQGHVLTHPDSLLSYSTLDHQWSGATHGEQGPLNIIHQEIHHRFAKTDGPIWGGVGWWGGSIFSIEASSSKTNLSYVKLTKKQQGQLHQENKWQHVGETVEKEVPLSTSSENVNNVTIMEISFRVP